MQKISTRIFIYSSVAFGIIGILLVMVGGPEDNGTRIDEILHKLLLSDVCIILPSFALSVASKYLNGKS